MAQIAIAWSLSKEGEYLEVLCWRTTGSIMAGAGVAAPIVGTTSLKNLEDIIGMRDTDVLSAAQLIFSY